MKKIKLLTCAVLLPMMLAGCGGGTSSSPTPVPSSDPTPVSSDEEESSSTYDPHIINVTGPLTLRRALVVKTEGESYALRPAFDEYFTFELERNGAENPIAINSDHVYVPTGAKITVTCAGQNYFYDNNAGPDGVATDYTNFTFLEAVDPSVLGLSGATGTAVENSVRLSFSGDVKTFSVVPTADLKLTTFTGCYGRIVTASH